MNECDEKNEKSFEKCLVMFIFITLHGCEGYTSHK